MDVVTGAIAVAVIVLIQGSGVSQNVPHEGGAPDASREFIAQGAANLASGLFRGLPVGGSLSGSAINVTSGAVGRWAGILSGVWMLAILVGLSTVIARVPMSSLAALLVIAGGSLIDPSDAVSVWRAGWASRLTSATTFVSTLFLPIQVAVGFGVALSAILFVNESATHIGLVELRRREDGRIEERSAPKRLQDGTVTVLDVYGPLFFAGARTLEHRLPSPRGVRHPAVVLRLRGRTSIGATLIDVLVEYARRLRDVDGRLYVTGLDQDGLAQLLHTKAFTSGNAKAYQATAVVWESTNEAYRDAEAWVVEASPQPPSGPGDVDDDR